METNTKPKQTKVQIFRNTANDEQWKEIVACAISDNPIGASLPDTYGFSWSAIRNDAIERGYYQPKRRPSSTTSNPVQDTIPVFRIDDITEDPECISRSIQIYTDISDRLNALCNSKQQYTKKAILNQLLDEALRKYGF